MIVATASSAQEAVLSGPLLLAIVISIAAGVVSGSAAPRAAHR
jgi:hypothetical protein